MYHFGLFEYRYWFMIVLPEINPHINIMQGSNIPIAKKKGLSSPDLSDEIKGIP
jgi:hypothetical protein